MSLVGAENNVQGVKQHPVFTVNGCWGSRKKNVRRELRAMTPFLSAPCSSQERSSVSSSMRNFLEQSLYTCLGSVRNKVTSKRQLNNLFVMWHYLFKEIEAL